jgi:hypothetical protein
MDAALLNVAIAGVGVLGPGLSGWNQAVPVLRTPSDWSAAATVVPVPDRLPSTERRRAGVGIKAAIMLAKPQRFLSPTRFTNSVHNAPAGYWHIAAQSSRASTSLAAYDASFCAGLLEAAAQCVASQSPVLLVACDMAYPAPLQALRPLPDVFACALLLLPPGSAAAWPLGMSPAAHAQPTRCGSAELDALRQAIPAARALPLLQAMAHNEPSTLVLDGDGLSLALQIAVRA